MGDALDWPVSLERGLSAADAVEVGSYPMVMLVLRNHRCPCGGTLEPVGGSALHSRGRRTLERQPGVCERCGGERVFWFDITRFHGDPDAAGRFEDLARLMQEGLTLARSGLLDRARPRFQEVVDREPAFGLAWFHLGMVLLALGEAARSLRALQTAAAWCPLDADVHRGLARALEVMERPEQAARQARIAHTLRTVLDAGPPRD